MKDTAYQLLIVDDDKEVREGLTQIVDWESCGFQVVSALKDGEDGIRYLESHQVDVVLSDIMMTFVSGLSLAKHIYEKKLPTKIVLISGYQEFNLAKEALRYQVHDYLLKPTDLDEVYRVFHSLKEQLDQERADRERLMQDKELLNQRLRDEHIGHDELDEHNEHNEHNELTGHTETERKVISQAKQFVKENLGKVISLNEVADHVYLNPVYLSRLFKIETGSSFTDYVTKVRMEQAADLLRNTNMKIYEICEQAGYKDVRHFYKLFKKHAGYLPSEYRERRI